MNTPHGNVGGGIPFQAGCVETTCSIISLLHQHLHASFPAREIGAAQWVKHTALGAHSLARPYGRGHKASGPGWQVPVSSKVMNNIEDRPGQLPLENYIGGDCSCADWQSKLSIPQDFLFLFFSSKFNPTYHHFQKNPQIQSPKCYPSPVNHLKILTLRKGRISSLSGPSFLTSSVPHSTPPTPQETRGSFGAHPCLITDWSVCFCTCLAE